MTFVYGIVFRAVWFIFFVIIAAYENVFCVTNFNFNIEMNVWHFKGTPAMYRDTCHV